MRDKIGESVKGRIEEGQYAFTAGKPTIIEIQMIQQSLKNKITRNKEIQLPNIYLKKAHDSDNALEDSGKGMRGEGPIKQFKN